MFVGGPGFGTGLLEGALIGSMVAGAGRNRGSDVTVVTTGGVAAPPGTYYAGGPSGTPGTLYVGYYGCVVL